MGGKNLAAKLREMGVGAGKTDRPWVFVDEIYWHPLGHKLRHPRIDDPVDVKLRDDIVQNGIKDDIVVRWEHDPEGNEVLAGCDGSQRTIAGLAAQAIMQKAKSPLLIEGRVRAPIKILPGDCTDARFLIERQLADRNPLKKAHSTRVLAVTVCQMLAVGLTPKQILEVLPRDWTLAHIEAVGRLWHTLAPDVVEAFEEGAPVGLLPAILEAKPQARLSLLGQLLTAGMNTVQGASRFVNRRMSAAAAAEAPAESEEAAEAEESAESSEIVPEEHTNGSVAPPKKSAPAPVKKSVKKSSGEALNAKTVNKRIAQARQQSKMTAALNLFLVGAQLALGDRKQMDAILTIAKGLDPMTQNLIAGVFWRYGAWTPEIQAMTSDKVMSWVEEGDARPSTRAEKMTKKNGKKK